MYGVWEVGGGSGNLEDGHALADIHDPVQPRRLICVCVSARTNNCDINTCVFARTTYFW
jgi:hypothetical protein